MRSAKRCRARARALFRGLHWRKPKMAPLDDAKIPRVEAFGREAARP
jgi:hypothetical protein